jgi:hypothetical protein
LANTRIKLTDCGKRWRKRSKRFTQLTGKEDYYFPKCEYPTKRVAWYAWLSKKEQLENELKELDRNRPNPLQQLAPDLYKTLFSNSDTRELAKERLNWCIAHGDEIEAQRYRDFLENPSLMENIDLFWRLSPENQNGIWTDRLERYNKFKLSPQQATIGYQVNEFYGLKKTNVAPSTYGSTVERLEVFRKRIGENTLCETINETMVKSYRNWVLERYGNETNRTAHDLFCAFKEFVRYLANNKIIPRPENLADKMLVIKVHKLTPVPIVFGTAIAIDHL